MKFKELYEKGLDRKVNPAVSASDLSEETVNIEIDEYVFTVEIIKNLYVILSNIKSNQGSHVGIWINGYYGSGKSHFLKYASYCMTKKYADRAFTRLIEEAEKISNGDDSLVLEQEGVSLVELKILRDWYINIANVKIVMFNIGEVHDKNSDRSSTFTTIFWNRFNPMRGYNSTNLALAQYLEKALDEDGKFDEFKEYVRSNGYDWERNISRFAAGRLDIALEMAKHVNPHLSYDIIRKKILNNDINVSVEAFSAEMKEYLDKQNDKNYRVLFFVDEVSQFIGEHRDLLLQLQSLVENLYKTCESQVWIACTAQETIDKLVDNLGNGNSNDEIGKILGRFEVRASLKGTESEFITQHRILEKKPEVNIALGEMFDDFKSKLDAQFILPSLYKNKMFDKKDFIASYPFVSYQFQLAMRVLDAFEEKNFVEKQVKGNERSLLYMTYSIAKETAEWEVGQFIPFDKFYGAMTRGALQHLGKRAFENAEQVLKDIRNNNDYDYDLYSRVAYILFMICNLSDKDKPSFSANIDNIVTLLMTEMDTNKAVLKDRVEKILSYFIDKSVIRKKIESGNEIYEFYTQDEAEVAAMINRKGFDGDTYAKELFNIINRYFIIPNKETYATRSFTIGCYTDGRSCSENTAEIIVDFIIGETCSAETYALRNPQNHLVFYLAPQWGDAEELRKNFFYCCKVKQFEKDSAILSEQRKATFRKFQEDAKTILDKEIAPQLQQILNTCSIISGQSILSLNEIGGVKNKERYKKAINYHLSNVYIYGKLVDTKETPKNKEELSAKILRPIETNLAETPLTEAENKIIEYLDKQYSNVTVDNVIQSFAKIPYGWSEIACIYTLNELVRRQLYSFSYNNNPYVSPKDIAQNILKERGRFTIEKAKAISQDTINKFVDAWKYIFNVVSIPDGNDSVELFRYCKESENSAMKIAYDKYNALSRKFNSYSFVTPINDAIAYIEDWQKIHSPKEFFETISSLKETAGELFDVCKEIINFDEKQYTRYEEIIRFINDNRDNFSFLSEDQKVAIDSINAIKENEKPWECMPEYIRLMKSLSGRLEECKASLIEKVKANYNKIFDDLEAYAKDVNVSLDKFANRNKTIQEKTSTNNFYALKANADTKFFYEEQMNVINAAIEEVISPLDESADETIKPKVRKRKPITINTHSKNPIRTEEDVDMYLQDLKREIMPYINNDNEIIIN